MKPIKIFALFALLAATFAGGYIVRASKRSTPAALARRVLYYVDAMNPVYKSDKPGAAPDGMALQPVYADETAGTTGEDPSIGASRGDQDFARAPATDRREVCHRRTGRRCAVDPVRG